MSEVQWGVVDELLSEMDQQGMERGLGSIAVQQGRFFETGEHNLLGSDRNKVVATLLLRLLTAQSSMESGVSRASPSGSEAEEQLRRDIHRMARSSSTLVLHAKSMIDGLGFLIDQMQESTLSEMYRPGKSARAVLNSSGDSED